MFCLLFCSYDFSPLLLSYHSNVYFIMCILNVDIALCIFATCSFPYLDQFFINLVNIKIHCSFKFHWMMWFFFSFSEMNRHHYAWFVRNCRLILLLRRDFSEGDLNIFRPAEWRWKIPQVTLPTLSYFSFKRWRTRVGFNKSC